MIKWLAAVLLLLAIPAARPAAQAEDPAVTLAKAEALWKEHRPQGYDFTLEVKCFCSGLVKPPPTFRVLLDQSAPTAPLGKSSLQTYERFDTIEKLFAVVRTKMAFGRHKLVVQYDPQNGIPLLADLDPMRTMADDEVFFRVTGFKPVELVRIR